MSEVLHQGPLVTKASKALILIHGRGGTARSILSLADRICDHDFYVAAPQATGNTWYPHSYIEEEKLNEPYLSISIKAIKDLLDQVAKHIPKNQIFFGGFSQGACLALEVSTRFAVKYGGIFAFTGGLIGNTIEKGKYQGDFEETKVFISNGDQDPHIPLMRSEQSKELMETLGAHVTLKVYKGRPHTITEDEIKIVKSSILCL
ncbi:MAG: dienelactone hydrolase family protein [Parachlamydiaceae bacterium]|nr:dienelactone hydrolase family protein [Parachlamydiaceae bacterium]